MSSKRYDEREIVDILRRVDRQLDRQHSLTNICQELGISRSSLHRWQLRYRLRATIEQRVEAKTEQGHFASLLAETQEQVQALAIAAEGN